MWPCPHDPSTFLAQEVGFALYASRGVVAPSRPTPRDEAASGDEQRGQSGSGDCQRGVVVAEVVDVLSAPPDDCRVVVVVVVMPDARM